MAAAGGWPGRPSTITLAQIQDALNEPVIVLAKAEEMPGCAIEQAVNAALDDAVSEARALLARKLATVSLADLFNGDRSSPMRHPPDPRIIMLHDVIIVGGSFAGLSAAMQLARARRKVLLVDAGLPRNRFADAAHGFLGHDGKAPGKIVREAMPAS
jgi:NADPH-dependent 2,4-dienoyl-CoA reductase/sulfur reductase-like enzyme